MKEYIQIYELGLKSKKIIRGYPHLFYNLFRNRIGLGKMFGPMFSRFLHL